MSIFGKIDKSRKAAKEHKASAAKEKGPEEVVRAPYKHVPTHAAVDALSGAPSSWNQIDRPRIREQHKRRSEMKFSQTARSSNIPAHSQVAAGPSASIPLLPQSSSYSSLYPLWFDRNGHIYANDNRLREPRQGRFKAQGGHSYHDSGIGRSPLAYNVQSEDVSPVVSSSNSTNFKSSGNLETPRPAHV